MKSLFFIFLCSFLIFQNDIFAKEYKVAALYWSMSIEGQVAMRKGIENEVEKINKRAQKNKSATVKIIPFVAGDGESGILNQVQQLDQVVSRSDIDLILIQPTDNAALTAGLVRANKAKIPVVTYDQYILGGKVVSYITSNNYQAGALDGDYIASKFNDDYKIKIVLVEYPNVSSTVERVDGFIDALKKAKQAYKIIKAYRAVEPVSGKKAGLDMIRDFPKKGDIDVVFTINDGGGLAVVDELRKAGRSEILVATIDGDPRTIINIKKGNLTVIDSAQFCGEIGRKSLEIAYRHLNGERVAAKILIPTFPITKETMKKYPGWSGSIPASFPLPWRKGEFWNNKLVEFHE